MRVALLSLLMLVVTAPAISARASVVMTGTRVIYPEASTGKTLQFSSEDDHPWLVQMWLDAGHEGAPEAPGEEVPFVISPPIFRVEPRSGHVVRLRFVGDKALSVDRESLFYFNFSQIPALSAEEMEGSRLLLVHNSRLKLLYRPRALGVPDARKLACALRFKLDGAELSVENPAAFHAVVSRAELRTGGGQVTLLEGETLAPFSSLNRTLPQVLDVPQHARVQVTLINDYGADVRHDCPLL